MSLSISRLVDAIMRDRSPEQVLGGRAWSNYTWHGDQAPTGMQLGLGVKPAAIRKNFLQGDFVQTQKDSL